MRLIIVAVTAVLSVFFVQSKLAIAHEVMPKSLPVGDGKVSDQARANYVFSCSQSFRSGGARHTGAWFKGDTWNPQEKPHVQGNVLWREAAFETTLLGNTRLVKLNGLPVNAATGIFPIARTDPVYVYDTNPNAIVAQQLSFVIPLSPVKAAQPSCLPMGMIGFALNGVAFYNALDDAGNDAAAHEVQDLCDGHPQGKGQYHYHSSSRCLTKADSNAHIGWALDGYPILGMRDADGKLLTNAALDACHGRPEKVVLDGLSFDYAYRLTPEYPYTLGCFMGQLLPETRQSIRQSMGPPKSRGADGRPGR